MPRLRQDIARAEKSGIRPQSLDFHRAIVAAELDTLIVPGLPVQRPSGAELQARPLANSSPAATWRGHGSAAAHRPGAGRRKGPPPHGLMHRSPGALAAMSARIGSRGMPRFVQVFDLGSGLPDPSANSRRIFAALHVARGEYVDQSVRGGTQTDGPLLSRIDPWARQLRAAIIGAVETYVGTLPEADLNHPLLSKRRDRRIRFAGSWSVNLRPGGRHANHVHPEGWISSALYISLPPKAPR